MTSVLGASFRLISTLKIISITFFFIFLWSLHFNFNNYLKIKLLQNFQRFKKHKFSLRGNIYRNVGLLKIWILYFLSGMGNINLVKQVVRTLPVFLINYGHIIKFIKNCWTPILGIHISRKTMRLRIYHLLLRVTSWFIWKEIFEILSDAYMKRFPASYV